MHNILYIHHRLNNIPNPLGNYLSGLTPKIPVTIAETTINSKSKISDIKEYIQDLGSLDTYTLVICDVPAISKKLLGVTKTHGLYKNIYTAKGLSVLTTHTPKLFIYDKTKEAEVFEDIALLKKYFKDNTVNNFVKDSDLDIKLYPSIFSLLSEHRTELINSAAVTIDIEATGLHVMRDKLTSISFSINKLSAFACFLDNSMYAALRDLLERMDGYHIYHNAQFDLKMLIRALYMDSIDDYRGMLAGLHILARNVHDTQVMAYLCLNSVARPDYSLKSLAYPYLGEYGDYTQTGTDLLVYNGKDTIGTFYVYEKFAKLMKAENQVQTYVQLFRPTIKTLTLTELVGMPIDYKYTKKLYREFRIKLDTLTDDMSNLPLVKFFMECYRIDACAARNAKLKTKVVHVKDAEFQKMKFNPNSNNMLQDLLYGAQFFDLPMLSFTKKNNPATDKAAIKSLLLHKHSSPEAIEFLELIQEYGELYVITNTFLKAFIHDSLPLSDGSYRLFGNFRQGAVISGRLSSSNVNLMNLPSHGNKHAKAVKRCFKPGKGKLFIGIDADSLEDKISALTTKDPNKLKLYIDGYDGHCMRAFRYYPEDMPDIAKDLKDNPDDAVNIINSIAIKYPKKRQDSKTPTFALTYQGTTHTLETNCGMLPDEAQKVYDAYHSEYRVSTEWVNRHIEHATEVGYVVGAFGLKLRTPILSKTMKNKLDSPLAAQEARSAGNMLGQSYGMLNQRSTNEFMEYVWDSPFATEILPTAQIHDAAYFEIFNRIEPIMFCNFHLPKTLAWQELPDIKHDIVKLSATLEVYFPSWANAIKLPNNATKQDIINIANNRSDK